MDRKPKITIVEQYLSWRGHYRQYFENLVSEDYNYIYCSTLQDNYPNSKYIQTRQENNNQNNFTSFVKGRFVNSLLAYKKVIELKPDLVHLIEFEPISFLYLLLFSKKKIPRLIITIHSVDRMRYANKVKDLISAVQRKIYQYTLRKAAVMGATFVTHYNYHQEQLSQLIGQQYRSSISVINYPCPENQPIFLPKIDSHIRLLIYGQIREDKGIFDFLSNPETEELDITIAGKIRDQRILKLNRPKLRIINEFISEKDLRELIQRHNFMFLPYQINYTGGAGTLKDSLSYGLPVIASDIPIFREVIHGEKVGFIFKTVSDIKIISSRIDQDKYSTLQTNCRKYALTYNWNYMRNEYFSLYEKVIGSI